MAEVLQDTTLETINNDAAQEMGVDTEEPISAAAGLEPPWANEPLLSDATPATAKAVPTQGQEPEAGAIPAAASTEVNGQEGKPTDGQEDTTTEVQEDIQAIQQFNGQHQMQYPQMTPHGPQPYYHDPVIHAQYHYPHPKSGYMNQIPNPPGTKAKRKRASPHQLALLNQIFEYTFFPSTELRNAIGKELGMAPRTVQIWFQNRRQAWRSTKVVNADGSESTSAKSNDNERGGWEVLRSFQARRANGEIQEYEYMAIPSPSSVANGQDGRVVGGYSLVPYHPGMMQVALSSNDQFNSSMQQVPMPLPHTPRPNANLVMGPPHLQQLQQFPRPPSPPTSAGAQNEQETSLGATVQSDEKAATPSSNGGTAPVPTMDTIEPAVEAPDESMTVSDNVDPSLETAGDSTPAMNPETTTTTTTTQEVSVSQVNEYATTVQE